MDNNRKKYHICEKIGNKPCEKQKCRKMFSYVLEKWIHGRIRVDTREQKKKG